VFQQFRLYQDNRLKINKESRESKMAARKEGGGAKKGSAKMSGVVRLIAIEGYPFIPLLPILLEYNEGVLGQLVTGLKKKH